MILCDERDELRRVVRVSLERDDQLRVIGEAADGPSAVALAARTRPDVAVLELTLPGLSAQQLLAAVRESAPDAAVVLFSGERPSAMQTIARADDGPVFVVAKTSPPAQLRLAVGNAALSLTDVLPGGPRYYG